MSKRVLTVDRWQGGKNLSSSQSSLFEGIHTKKLEHEGSRSTRQCSRIHPYVYGFCKYTMVVQKWCWRYEKVGLGYDDYCTLGAC